MDSTTLLILVVVVLLAIVGWLAYERRRTDTLRSKFGPEYRRTIEATGDRREAEAELQARERRVAALDIRPLPAAERARYAEAWRDVQSRFVDEPAAAIAAADGLIGQVMEARGYPVSEFEQRVADISVDHPDVVEHYRLAHQIAARRDEVTTDTESLRRAMVHYRALFDDLLGGDEAALNAGKPAAAEPVMVTREPAVTADAPPTPAATTRETTPVAPTRLERSPR
jgi:predicted nucleic acid-binding protein